MITDELKQALIADLGRAHGSPPKLVQLAYSGGKASEALLWMVLRGEIEIPAPRLIVTCANPGMENPHTYLMTAAMERRCKDAGIPFLRAEVDLYEGIMQAKKSGAKSFDFPAFFTKNRETGKIGKMKQRCTQWCKIAPMDRLARHWMDANLGISKKSKRLGEKILCKWVGFTFDEIDRIKVDRHAKYVCMEYPLVSLRLTADDIVQYYAKNNLVLPPRSVCNACFANDEIYFKMLHDQHPTAWQQAVNIDNEIRDLSQFGMTDECFVYGGCVPLTELAARGFPCLRRKEQQSCHSGHCFN